MLKNRALTVGLMLLVYAGGSRGSHSWSPKLAAAYLDKRAEWWTTWSGAARDHETFCISCHTPLPYTMARPALRAALGESSPPIQEQRIVNSVTKRVRLWNEVEPFYSDHTGANKAAESRGTESVLNALVLSIHPQSSGLSREDTRTALSQMLALQLTTGESKGAWMWLQFDNEPWEAHDSQYYGAAIAALAVAASSQEYRSQPDVRSHLELLRDYVRREYYKQSLINRVVLLWASTKWPELLTLDQRAELIAEILNQQQEDGGWSLASLAWTWKNWNVTSLLKSWTRADASPSNAKTDGYSTGLITLALQQAGVSDSDNHVRRGLSWLATHQQADGSWPAYSLNGHRDPAVPTGLFMNDAATAYAVLALLASDH